MHRTINAGLNTARLFFTGCALLLAIATGMAGTTGKIAGRVTHARSGETLPAINVVIVGTSMGAATDLDGRYAILNVPPGKYTLRASGVGYAPRAFERVSVSMDLTTTIDVTLDESAVELADQVVIAQRPIVTRDLTASTAVIDAEKLEALPITTFQEVLRLQAGVVGGTVRGGRAGEVVYAIDGVPMTDVYDGSTVVDVNPNAIQELQFVSGAFNAEYGRALSGYVNIATKDGDRTLRGTMTAYAGDYLSTHTTPFRAIDRVDPLAVWNLEGSLSGSFVPDRLSFIANARTTSSRGWMNGTRVFHPWDITVTRGSDVPLEGRYQLNPTGDGESVPMNWSERVYAQGKFTYKPVPTVSIAYNAILDRVRYQDYEHQFFLNPDGMVKRLRTSISNVFSVGQTLSPEVYYKASGSYFFKEYKHAAYEDVSDPRYTDYRLLNQQPKETPSVLTGGTDNHHFRRTTSTYGVKLDITAQATRVHQIKAGVDLGLHKLTFDEFTLLQDDGLADPRETMQPFVRMRVPDPNNPAENLSVNRYRRRPIEFSAYLQDKIELQELIINAGVRFDYFKPDGVVLNDPSDPDIYRPLREANIARTMSERRAFWYRKATVKTQFSPRLGVAFPITDQGVVHFSYGHFFQIPNFSYLYENPEFKFGTGAGNLGIAGNPDLKPEQTIVGEVGVQQGLTEDLSIDVTGYFRNIRNLTGTRADEILLYGGSGRYSQYVNSDFGFVRGIVLTVTKRMAGGWGATVDYTFQSVKGNASDPAATRNQLVGGAQPEVQLVPLNWDQRHTLNATVSYARAGDWGVSVIAQYGSGFPYTPTQSINVSDLLTNSELRPPGFTVDLRANKDFRVWGTTLTLFARVFNLLDAKNQLQVYANSGTADFTLDEYLARRQGLPPVVNTIEEYYRNPLFYSEPRRVEMGFTVSWE